MLNIYLDCCAINRPLDDQRHPQVAVEAGAIRQILLLVRWKRANWIGAPILRVELEACADQERKTILLSLMSELCQEQSISIEKTDTMLEKLSPLRLSLPDAVHLVSAVKVGADFFITCDKRLVKMSGRIESLIGLAVKSPLQAIAELPL